MKNEEFTINWEAGDVFEMYIMSTYMQIDESIHNIHLRYARQRHRASSMPSLDSEIQFEVFFFSYDVFFFSPPIKSENMFGQSAMAVIDLNTHTLTATGR